MEKEEKEREGVKKGEGEQGREKEIRTLSSSSSSSVSPPSRFIRAALTRARSGRLSFSLCFSMSSKIHATVSTWAAAPARMAKSTAVRVNAMV